VNPVATPLVFSDGVSGGAVERGLVTGSWELFEERFRRRGCCEFSILRNYRAWDNNYVESKYVERWIVLEGLEDRAVAAAVGSGNGRSECVEGTSPKAPKRKRR
jgi:hypothetical protein